jgi:hypothetical protein
MAHASAIHRFEIAPTSRYPPTMPNQTGPKTSKGKAITRLNATKSGIYSVTPVVPAFERERDWRAHHAEVFADLQPEGYMQEIIDRVEARLPVLIQLSLVAFCL